MLRTLEDKEEASLAYEESMHASVRAKSQLRDADEVWRVLHAVYISIFGVQFFSVLSVVELGACTRFP
jgi:hypothetical protein